MFIFPFIEEMTIRVKSVNYRSEFFVQVKVSYEFTLPKMEFYSDYILLGFPLLVFCVQVNVSYEFTLTKLEF